MNLREIIYEFEIEYNGNKIYDFKTANILKTP